MGDIPKVTEQNFEQEVLTATQPVLVEFGAEWCGPCKVVAPELAALKLELAGKAKIVQVDVDECPRVAQAMKIQSVPTFVVFLGGRPVDAAQGALKKQQLRALLEKHLPQAPGTVKPAEAALLLKKQRLTPVDIRPANVFARAHIENSLSFPIDTIRTRLDELQALPVPALLYCRDGKEATALAAELAQSGVPVSFLDGGVLGWEAEGFRLYRPS